MSPEILLHVDGLVSNHGRIEVLHGVSLEVPRGGIVAIIGSNGAGKTTLLRAISGVQPVTAGRVVFDGEPVGGLPPERRVRLGIGQVPEGRQLFAPLSVDDNLRLGAFSRRDNEIETDLERMYTLFPALEAKKTDAAGTLSGGQQQMVAMARALMARPRLLLLDEPSMGLSPLLVREVFSIIERLNAGGVTVLLVEQNARLALDLANWAYVLESGRVAMSGPAAQLKEDERVAQSYLGG